MLDAERQIRFLYPPVFLVASLFLGVRLDNDIAIADVCKTLMGESLYKTVGQRDWSTPTVALATAGGLIATVAAGFLISSVTVLSLGCFWRLGFKWWKFETKSYEAARLPNIEGIRRRLKVKAPTDGSDALFLSATVDHEFIPRPIHNWMFRRWSMFYVYAHSATEARLRDMDAMMMHVRETMGLLTDVRAMRGRG